MINESVIMHFKYKFTRKLYTILNCDSQVLLASSRSSVINAGIRIPYLTGISDHDKTGPYSLG